MYSSACTPEPALLELAPPPGLSAEEHIRWRRALADVAENIVEGRYFGAGREFGPVVFTRDVAFSGVLSLNALCPELMRSTLRFDREVRLGVGWRVTAGSSAAQVTGLPFEDTGLDYHAFVKRYRTGEFTRRTDDVIWLWAMHDWLRRHGHDEADWLWTLETGLYCHQHYYAPFFDPADGLYRGQATFVDIMMCGYAPLRRPEHPNDATDFLVHHVDDASDDSRWRVPGLHPASLRRSILGKTASTNALYVLGFDALAACARRLGERDMARAWDERAESLRAAMRAAFVRPDGAVRFMRECDGTLNERQHPLGTALCVLAGVLAGDAARRALGAIPRGAQGVPLFHPFYEENPHVYHNRSSWPFADVLVEWAQWQTTREPSARDRALAYAGRVCDGEKGFRELVELPSGRLTGSGHQLWSAAAYLGAARGFA